MSFIDDVRWMRDYGVTKSGTLELWEHPAQRADAGGNHPALVYVEDLVVEFSGFRALDISTFYVNRGELRFLIGPNGAGKSTLLDVICRKTKPKSGRLVYDGFIDLAEFSISQVSRLGISRKFQTPSVFPRLSVRENLELACPRYYRVFSGLRSQLAGEDRDEIERILALTGLLSHADLPASTLAHGQKQWLELGMTILQKPKLLMVDEPAAGMSEREREATGLLLEEIAKDCSVLVVEHDMHFVKRFARSVSVLHEGRIICEGSFDYVSSQEEVLDVYLGRGKSSKGERNA